MKKLATVDSVIKRINDGSTLMIGGFLGYGTPEGLVDALVKKSTKNLTVIANDTAFEGKGIGKLVCNNQIKKAIVSHIGTNPVTGRKMHAGEMEVELVPQGTLAERIRSGGAGLGGILTPTGIGTVVEENKKKVEINGKNYLIETPLRAEVALIKAYKADAAGNLVFRKSSRNFNPLMAMAADFVVVEVEYFVEIGEISPDEVMLPGIFVDAITLHEKEINAAVEGGA